ncbi:MAG: hypothetical protein AB4290_30420 [Spirulina sp.]
MGSVLVSICGIDRQCSLYFRDLGAVADGTGFEVARSLAAF